MNKKRAGASFLAIGVAFLAIGMSSNSTLTGVGAAFLAIGAAFPVRSRH